MLDKCTSKHISRHICFSVSGGAFPYQMGIAAYMQKNFDLERLNVQYTGASGGTFPATTLAIGFDIAEVMEDSNNNNVAISNTIIPSSDEVKVDKEEQEETPKISIEAHPDFEDFMAELADLENSVNEMYVRTTSQGNV